MSKKAIFIGAFGQIILKEELLKHLKARPGEEIHYKLLPGNKLLLQSFMSDETETQSESYQYNKNYELADLKAAELLLSQSLYPLDKNSLH